MANNMLINDKIDYNKIFCNAVDTIVSKRLENISFDNTVTAEIIDATDAEFGHYIVREKDLTYDVMSENYNYKVGDKVYVTIPGGDYNKTKVILSAYKDKEQLAALHLVRPKDITISQTIGLNTNIPYDNLALFQNSVQEHRVNIYGSSDNTNLELSTYQTDRTRLSELFTFCDSLIFNIDIKCNLRSSYPYVYKGAYKIELVRILNDTELVLGTLDMNALVGDPYGYYSYLPQSIVINLDALREEKNDLFPESAILQLKTSLVTPFEYRTETGETLLIPSAASAYTPTLTYQIPELVGLKQFLNTEKIAILPPLVEFKNCSLEIGFNTTHKNHTFNLYQPLQNSEMVVPIWVNYDEDTNTNIDFTDRNKRTSLSLEEFRSSEENQWLIDDELATWLNAMMNNTNKTNPEAMYDEIKYSKIVNYLKRCNINRATALQEFGLEIAHLAPEQKTELMQMVNTKEFLSAYSDMLDLSALIETDWQELIAATKKANQLLLRQYLPNAQDNLLVVDNSVSLLDSDCELLVTPTDFTDTYVTLKIALKRRGPLYNGSNYLHLVLAFKENIGIQIPDVNNERKWKYAIADGTTFMELPTSPDDSVPRNSTLVSWISSSISDDDYYKVAIDIWNGEQSFNLASNIITLQIPIDAAFVQGLIPLKIENDVNSSINTQIFTNDNFASLFTTVKQNMPMHTCLFYLYKEQISTSNTRDYYLLPASNELKGFFASDLWWSTESAQLNDLLVYVSRESSTSTNDWEFRQGDSFNGLYLNKSAENAAYGILFPIQFTNIEDDEPLPNVSEEIINQNHKIQVSFNIEGIKSGDQLEVIVKRRTNGIETIPIYQIFQQNRSVNFTLDANQPSNDFYVFKFLYKQANLNSQPVSCCLSNFQCSQKHWVITSEPTDLVTGTWQDALAFNVINQYNIGNEPKVNGYTFAHSYVAKTLELSYKPNIVLTTVLTDFQWPDNLQDWSDILEEKLINFHKYDVRKAFNQLNEKFAELFTDLNMSVLLNNHTWRTQFKIYLLNWLGILDTSSIPISNDPTIFNIWQETAMPLNDILNLQLKYFTAIYNYFLNLLDIWYSNQNVRELIPYYVSADNLLLFKNEIDLLQIQYDHLILMMNELNEKVQALFPKYINSAVETIVSLWKLPTGINIGPNDFEREYSNFLDYFSQRYSVLLYQYKLQPEETRQFYLTGPWELIPPIEHEYIQDLLDSTDQKQINLLPWLQRISTTENRTRIDSSSIRGILFFNHTPYKSNILNLDVIEANSNELVIEPNIELIPIYTNTGQISGYLKIQDIRDALAL